MSLRLLFLLICTALMGNIQAQSDTTPSYDYIIGGNGNFFFQRNAYPISSIGITSGIGGIFSNSTSSTRNQTMAISPYLGKHFGEHWVAGTMVDLRYGSYVAIYDDTDGEDRFTRRSFQSGIGVFGRYLLMPDRKFTPYVQPYMEYNLLFERNASTGSTGSNESANFLDMGTDIGGIYSLNERLNGVIRLGGLNFIHGKWRILDSDTKKSFTSFGSSFNFYSLRIGLEYRF